MKVSIRYPFLLLLWWQQSHSGFTLEWRRVRTIHTYLLNLGIQRGSRKNSNTAKPQKVALFTRKEAELLEERVVQSEVLSWLNLLKIPVKIVLSVSNQFLMFLPLAPAIKPNIRAFSARVTVFADRNISCAANICSRCKQRKIGEN